MPRDERQLLGRADRPADADRIVVGALPPRVDVFERLGEVELFERVVEDDLEARAGTGAQIARREPGGFVDQIGDRASCSPTSPGAIALEFTGHRSSDSFVAYG